MYLNFRVTHVEDSDDNFTFSNKIQRCTNKNMDLQSKNYSNNRWLTGLKYIYKLFKVNVHIDVKNNS